MGLSSPGDAEERQAVIRKEVSAYIEAAVGLAAETARTMKKLKQDGRNISIGLLRPIEIPYWRAHSDFQAHHYKLLKDKQKAIDADVKFFHEIVKLESAQYPEWNITVINSYSKKRKVPRLILVLQK